jgi:hypothetical protein
MTSKKVSPGRSSVRAATSTGITSASRPSIGEPHRVPVERRVGIGDPRRSHAAGHCSGATGSKPTSA